VEALVGALKNPDTLTRRVAAEALMKEQIIGVHLIDALKDSDSSVRLVAARALSMKGIEKICPVGSVAYALKDPSIEVREAVVDFLAGQDDPTTVGLLIEALGDGDRGVRVASSRALANKTGYLRNAAGLETIDPFIHALSDADREVRINAATILGNLGDRRATEPLIAALAKAETRLDDDWGRRRIIVSLGQIGDPRAAEPLIAALKMSIATGNAGYDSQWLYSNRISVIEALDRLADPRSAEPLIEFLTEPNLASKARQALTNILNRSANTLDEQHLRALCRIDDAYKAKGWSGDFDDPVVDITEDFTEIKNLAREELARRGLREN
jgi:HEAT repeat protein